MKEKSKKSLDKFLGLDEAALSDKEIAAKYDTLRDLDETADATQYKGRIDSAWQNIQSRTTTQKKPAKGKILNFKIMGTVGSIAAAALLFLVVNLGNTENELQLITHTQKKLNLKNGISSKDQLVTGTVDGLITVGLRQIKGFTAGKKDGQAYNMSFQSGALLISFAKTPATSLQIKTTRATYQVTGTHFIIESTPAKDTLVVQEGVVEVLSSENKKTMVTAGKAWHSKTSATIPLSTSSQRSYFERFQDKQSQGRIKFSLAPPDQKAVKISVIRKKNGDVIRGRILRQNANEVVIKSSIGTLTLPRNEIDSIE